MFKPRVGLIRPSLIMFGFALLAPGFASAEDAKEAKKPAGGIEEIIVTGTQREEAAQNVPIAISAYSDAQIKQTYRTDILALGEMAPGVALGQVAGFRAIAGGIRGTGQNSILVTQDSSVVVSVDDFALSNVQAQFVELFDVDRVEIYRGPQGTLFGKSATGGAISIITKRPVMNEYKADLQAQFGKFDGSDGPKNADINKYSVAVNVPIIEDKLSIRLVGLVDHGRRLLHERQEHCHVSKSVAVWRYVGLHGGGMFATRYRHAHRRFGRKSE